MSNPIKDNWYYNPVTGWIAKCTAIKNDRVCLRNDWLTWEGSVPDFEKIWQEVSEKRKIEDEKYLEI